MKARLRVSVENGKYTFILPEDDYRIKVLRYGEEWLTIEAGCNAVHSLMSELNDARQELSALNIMREENR